MKKHRKPGKFATTELACQDSKFLYSGAYPAPEKSILVAAIMRHADLKKMQASDPTRLRP